MAVNLLKNGAFEADWGEEKSHRCLLIPKDAAPYYQDIGNIFTPPGWVTWFHHVPGEWSQPEVRDAWKQNDPRRVHTGQKSILLFTFSRRHDAGFFQQVQVTPGARLRLSAWAQAWSNHKDVNRPDKFPHPDDGKWSEGAGYEAGFCLEGQAPDDNWRNFTFYVGIDPTGGTNPLADTVVWGQGAHIYNEHAQVPAVEATAQAATVTVFLRSKTLWPFKHNDAYWDDAELIIVDGGGTPPVTPTPPTPEVKLDIRPSPAEVGGRVTIAARAQADLTQVGLQVRPPSGAMLATGVPTVTRDGDRRVWTYNIGPLNEVGKYDVLFSAAGNVSVAGSFESKAAPKPAEPARPPRGQPREQYARTYILLPPGTDVTWAQAVVDATWDKYHYTIGVSADDAGIGDLAVRRVIAINPGKWPSDLRAFFNQYYPGVEYTSIEAATLVELQNKLKTL